MYPDARVISLGIGDTTEPIPEVMTSAIAERSRALSIGDGYSGYGAEQGEKQLSVAIASSFYGNLGIEEGDIFVSDGAKCDISRLQAYVDSSVIMGQTRLFQKDVETDIIFFCSPNNPTGATATREQLTKLVKFAKRNGSIVVYDSAYAMYIPDDSPPPYLKFLELKRYDDVAIETASFSKHAEFTGVPLGWTVVPKELLFCDGFPVAMDFNHTVCTCFNGASNIAQAGDLACSSLEGLEAMRQVVGFYKENTDIIVDTFKSFGFSVYGGKNAPYVRVHFPG
ncbi:LL-diaminopimelate aminotransferase, chloroplastic [Ancistrocladus abbreviatus]